MKKITIALIMVISLIAPIQTMAESVTQNGTITVSYTHLTLPTNSLV